MRGFVEGLGGTWPTYADWVSAAAALMVAALAIGAGWLAGRTLGPRLADLWARRLGTPGEWLSPRMCALIRWLVAVLLLALALALETWRPLGALVLGLALATCGALLVSGVVRGLHMPRSAAWLLAAAAFVALLARAVGGLEPVTNLLDAIGFDLGSRRLSLLTLLQIAVGLLALYAAARFLNRLAGQTIRRTAALDPTQQLLAQKLAGVAILITAFFVGIDLVGIDLTALAIFSGAFGLAVGFGFQKTFGNLIAGIILLMDRSIKPGDVISVGESFGSVSKIGVRAVSIVTREGKEHLIPNEILMTEEVINWSYSTRDVRISIPIGIAYDCDVKLAQKLMVEAATASTRVLDTPKPVVWMTAFGESSIDHEIRVWIVDPEAGLGAVRSDILNRVWELFKENGIQVPYPQRDVRVKEWPGGRPIIGSD
jgi:small-conductance mechanosensitive channel